MRLSPPSRERAPSCPSRGGGRETRPKCLTPHLPKWSAACIHFVPGILLPFLSVRSLCSVVPSLLSNHPSQSCFLTLVEIRHTVHIATAAAIKGFLTFAARSESEDPSASLVLLLKGVRRRRTGLFREGEEKVVVFSFKVHPPD